MPKFRGGSDDWLDDQKTRVHARAGGAVKQRAKAKPLEPDQANATVAEIFPNQCRVRLDEGARDVLCAYRRAGVIGASGDQTRERSPVAVGDRVRVTARLEGDDGVVEGLCRRENFLSRAAPGRDTRTVRHVIAANIDVLAIVDSVHEPDFSGGLVDRYLVAAEAAGIEPVIVVTKSDLAEAADQPEAVYSALGIRTFRVSALRQEGIDALTTAVRGRRVAFCGHSGVGKTSLLRVLSGAEVGAVAAVSDVTGKGRHTTTGAVLIPGTSWIDTPGVREFSLDGIEADDLAGLFAEFRSLECAVRGCRHAGEEGCLAKGLARYASYRRILDSIIEETAKLPGR